MRKCHGEKVKLQSELEYFLIVIDQSLDHHDDQSPSLYIGTTVQQMMIR